MPTQSALPLVTNGSSHFLPQSSQQDPLDNVISMLQELQADRDNREQALKRDILSQVAHMIPQHHKELPSRQPPSRENSPSSSVRSCHSERRSPTPPESSDDTKLKLAKAFKMVKDATKADIYGDKSGPLIYQSWKMALKREVSHLTLEPTQWLELLKTRTKGEARKVLLTAESLQLDLTPEEILKMSWEFLDERFKTSKQPSQEILNTILTGPPITSEDPSSLTEFSQACAAALRLKESGSLALSPLDNQTTQESVFDRLSLELNRKWYKYRIKNDLEDGPVPFEKFAQWI